MTEQDQTPEDPTAALKQQLVEATDQAEINLIRSKLTVLRENN